MTAPVDLRLENPPPDFVGRSAEIAELRAVLKAAPCVEVHGPPGIGKSALVQCALARRRAKQAPVRIELLADTPAHERIVDGLRRAGGQTEGRAPSESIQAWYVIALELAEADRRWVVIEDFHLAPEHERTACMTLIANHARRSRWVFVGWRPTPCPTAVLRIPVTGLAPDVLRQLLTRRLRAPAARVETAVRLSGGSPRAALQHASGVGADPWWVPEGERAAAHRLALSQVPLPARHLGATPEMLIRRGLAVAGPGGVRAHAAARRAWEARWLTALTAERVTLATLLVEDPSPVLQLEAVRLLGVAGDLGRLDEALERRCEALLATGHVLGLWHSVRHLAGIDRWRLRIAAELGTAEALAWVPERPPQGRPTDQQWWARCWLLRGEFERALHCAAPLAEALPGAGLTAALCLMNLGRFDEAEQLLARRPDDRRWTIRRSTCLARMGQVEEARALAAQIRQSVVTRSASLGPVDTFALARTFLDLEDFTTAATLLDDLPVGQVGGGPTAARLAQYHVAEHRGDFERVAVLDADLKAHAGSVLLGTSVHLAQLRSALSLGRLEHFERRLERVTRSIERAGLPANFHGTLAADFGRMMGAPPPPWPATLDATSGPVFTRWSARHGRAPERRWRQTPVQRGLSALAEAELTLARGDRVDTVWAVAMARSAGLGAIEVDALSVACDAAIVSRDWPRLGRVTDDLAQAGRGSPRYQAIATFYRWIASPDDFGPLEDLATQMQIAPMAARRARALLGDAARLDRVDENVLANLQRAERFVRGSGPGWGIDCSTQAVWRAEAQAVSLAKRPVAWGLLRSLVDAGGAASKEALVEAIWREPYHPLKHDNRLQVAVRAVRTTIEVDPQHPTRLITHEHGYALGGPCGVR